MRKDVFEIRGHFYVHEVPKLFSLGIGAVTFDCDEIELVGRFALNAVERVRYSFLQLV